MKFPVSRHFDVPQTSEDNFWESTNHHKQFSTVESLTVRGKHKRINDTGQHSIPSTLKVSVFPIMLAVHLAQSTETLWDLRRAKKKTCVLLWGKSLAFVSSLRGQGICDQMLLLKYFVRVIMFGNPGPHQVQPIDVEYVSVLTIWRTDLNAI